MLWPVGWWKLRSALLAGIVLASGASIFLIRRWHGSCSIRIRGSGTPMQLQVRCAATPRPAAGSRPILAACPPFSYQRRRRSQSTRTTRMIRRMTRTTWWVLHGQGTVKACPDAGASARAGCTPRQRPLIAATLSGPDAHELFLPAISCRGRTRRRRSSCGQWRQAPPSARSRE